MLNLPHLPTKPETELRINYGFSKLNAQILLEKFHNNEPLPPKVFDCIKRVMLHGSFTSRHDFSADRLAMEAMNYQITMEGGSAT